MKNRTVIGVICIVLAVVIMFGLTPVVASITSAKTDIVRMKTDVSKGHQITSQDVEIVTVGGENLPSEVIRNTESVVGKYASTDLKTDDYILPSKLSDNSQSSELVMYGLDGSKRAMSITISSFAGGLSGKLENGDIISLIVTQNNKSEIPAELQYVKVITTTTSGGVDKDSVKENEDGSYEMPSTITVLVNTEQAELLAGYDNDGKIHAALVYRGDEATSQKFIDAQDKIFVSREANINE